MSWRTGTWDFVSLDGMRLEGHVIKFDVAPSRNIETTPVPGLDGVDLKDQGYVGSPVTIGLECIKSVQFDKLAAQLAMLNPRQPGVAIKPRTIDHPLARLANITQVYITGFSAGMPDDTGKWQVEIQAFQFAQAKKKAPAAPAAPGDGGSLNVDVNIEPNPSGFGGNFP